MTDKPNILTRTLLMMGEDKVMTGYGGEITARDKDRERRQ